MEESSKKLIEKYRSCEGFFKEALDNAVASHGFKASTETMHYLLALLVLGVKNNPCRDEHGNDRWIGKMYVEASFFNEYKAVGDLCLLIVGVWQQSLSRKLINAGYYASIGSRAYQRAGKSVRDRFFSDIFEELAIKFWPAANVMTEATGCISYPKNVSEMNDIDILNMIENWSNSHNPFLAKKLAQLGVFLNPGNSAKQ